MPSALVFQSDEGNDFVLYTFTVQLHGRAEPEFAISVGNLEKFIYHERDNPLLEILALRLRDEDLDHVVMCVRLYHLNFKILRDTECGAGLSEIDTKYKIKEVVEEFCAIGQHHEPVHARLTDI